MSHKSRHKNYQSEPLKKDMMDNQSPSPKQQIVERLKAAQSIVVTVNQKPRVDEIAAALGLTQILERFGKKVVTIISAPVPRELNFLKPERYVDDKIDRLRDFVIALDKEKADKLRYKAEDDVVKIFITPYKSAIAQSDLRFSQGDYNVDTVVVIGAASRDSLDRILLEHTAILRDATVMSLSVGSEPASVGTPTWHEAEASSVAELLVSVADSLQTGLLDAEAAQSLLTSIVAATDGFRNKATTPKVMTIAAQLMASGADQQVIMNQFQPKESKPAPAPLKQRESQKNFDQKAAPKPNRPRQTIQTGPTLPPIEPPKPVTQPASSPKPDTFTPPLPPTPNPIPHGIEQTNGSTADSALAADAIDAVIANAKQVAADIDRNPATMPEPTYPVALNHAPMVANSAPAPEVPEFKINPEPPVLEPTPPESPTPLPMSSPQPAVSENVDAARQAVAQAMWSQPQTGLPTADGSIGTRTLQNNADVTINHPGSVNPFGPAPSPSQ